MNEFIEEILRNPTVVKTAEGDPADAERQGKAAVEGALEAIRARNAGVGGTDGR